MKKQVVTEYVDALDFAIASGLFYERSREAVFGPLGRRGMGTPIVDRPVRLIAVR
ncbi:MAG: hypothetical protein ACRC44_00030 [Bifidobacterium asteroides]